MPNFELTRAESIRLENLLGVARMQEELLNCVTESYRNYIVTVVFPRLKLDAKDFAKTVVNLNTGELIIKDDEPVPQNPMKAEVKGGENGDRGIKPTAEAKH
jgi:hypothetical protein